MVIPSRIIHSPAVPRTLRVEFAADGSVNSGEEDRLAGPLFKNSDVAI
jgi:hypothetical protein